MAGPDPVRGPSPELSARRRLSTGQGWLLGGAAVGLLALIALRPVAAAIAIFAAATTLYVATFFYRFTLLGHALTHPDLVDVTEKQAQAVPDSELPTYTVLVPVYHEAEIVERTIAALERLDYPAALLDIKLIVEADDRPTIRAAQHTVTRLPLAIVAVPPSQPRTKPKACNYALALATGELVTIYDAEDRPDPLQLRKAALAFRRSPASVACLQAKLSYHNFDQNLITRLFTAEYDAWFALMLPALAALGGPVPLGGTSMHIRRRLLESVGGWDPFNVTEDADLGIRLQRLGYRVLVLESTTLEEANSDFVNWIKQRSRWYKGYLQTWLVHMRRPLATWKQLGTRGFIGLNLLVGAVPLTAAINPVFWLLTLLWFVLHPHFLHVLLPAPVYYAGLGSMIIGNFLALYTSLLALRVSGHSRLVVALIFSPLYWLMMSLAAVRAYLQLLVDPSYWEKSVHGLDEQLGSEVVPLVRE